MEEENNVRTFGFLTSSSILHAGLALLVVYYAGDIMEKVRPLPTTEIEILGTGDGGQTAALVAEPVVESKAADAQPDTATAPAPTTQAATAPAPDIQTNPVSEIPVPAAAPTKALPTKKVAIETPTAKPTLAKSTSATPAAKSAAKTSAAKSMAAPIHAPISEELDEAPALPVANYEDTMADDDLNEVSKNERSEHASQLAAAKADMDAAEEEISKQKSEMLAAVEKQNQEEDEKMAALVAEKKKAAQIAAQKAEQARIADAQSAAQARAEAAATAAAAKAQAIAAAAEQKGSGHGGGSNETGSSNVRGIQDLKQVIGNKKPEYDKDDRFNGRQGQVVFTAYVTPEGTLQNFQLVQSSGHKALDLKTLKALRAWKFHPGQEGIVEIPFKWDLVGGAQEMPTSLRRKIGQY